jgi:hypothetical protein
MQWKVDGGGVSCLVKLAKGCLATGVYDGTVIVWEISTGDALRTLELRFDWRLCRACGPGVLCLIQLGDGRLARGYSGGTVEVGLWTADGCAAPCCA